MKKFLLTTILYIILLLLSLAVILTIISNVVKNRGFENYETESNTLVIGRNTHYDCIFMGISHARSLSRNKNHLRIEKILNKKIINIAQGGGQCGVNEQLFYLDYFYYRGNTASTVLYVASPPMFFNKKLPIASNTFDKEIFEIGFLLKYLFFKSENKKERITSYLQTKITEEWYEMEPFSENSMDKILDSIDTKAIIEGQKVAYGDKLALQRFHKSAERAEETIQFAIENNSQVIIIIPPALFGKWIGHEQVVDFSEKMVKRYGVEFYDFSESILTIDYYYDHHHLNTEGVKHFTTEYLYPILND